MWNFASNCFAGHTTPKKDRSLKQHSQDTISCSGDEVSSTTSEEEEGLECPICWESFNLVENIPYVLWCGHTLCKNCVLGLQWAIVKFPTYPLQLPLFVSCPWCNLLSFRLVYKGQLKFPRVNFLLLWMLESMNGDRVKVKSKSKTRGNGQHDQTTCVLNTNHTANPATSARHSEPSGSNYDVDDQFDNYLSIDRLHLTLRKFIVFFIHVTSKFPLVVVFLLIVLYAIPASAAILALCMIITIVFAVPSFLILYFAYPSLDWLAREIVN